MRIFTKSQLIFLQKIQTCMNIFLTRRVFQKLIIKKDINLDLKKLLFSLCVQFTVGLITSENLSAILGKYFLQQIKDISKQSFSEEESKKIFIACMGSFSVGEMTFSSDIDLIFRDKQFRSNKRC